MNGIARASGDGRDTAVFREIRPWRRLAEKTMLEELRRLRDKGFPQEFLNRYAEYHREYAKSPLEYRMVTDFGYFLRMKYIMYLKKKK